jgi:hypothetical protein
MEAGGSATEADQLAAEQPPSAHPLAEPLPDSLPASQPPAPAPAHRSAALPAAARALCPAEEERLQEELGFLLESEVVGPANARAASFLWQSGGRFELE